MQGCRQCSPHQSCTFIILSLSFTGASWAGEAIPGESYPIITLLLQSLLHFQVLWVNTQLLSSNPKPVIMSCCQGFVVGFVLLKCTFQNRHVKKKKIFETMITPQYLFKTVLLVLWTNCKEQFSILIINPQQKKL